ncbi:MAG: 1-(5-phosphoribosyl)-5-[(5-phosphoribosylamino)methylideneamino]imidazole-4-carboxamide isomerase [Candidatus Omnitrophica bacterium]|nr:1-(5-phosphoribosyl)-5-[(5-phosphoribosylamino)methylideneamino]imidazole-4-carboxamide isomerase [Candidatus Omnitrophota bacterium]
MIVIPAIDLYQGKVVRLIKGDIKYSKVYSDNPVEIAKKWEAEGAELLHLVDLSAALGEGDNLEVIKDIIAEVDIEVQVGGGIRDIKKAKQLLSLGVERVIIGTKALDEDFLNEVLKSLGKEKFAIGVDVFNSCLAIDGWKEKTDFSGLDFVAYLQLKGISWVIYTDVCRDGTLEGLDFDQITKLDMFSDMKIIASGGVASLDDLRLLKKRAPFIWGVIVGKALYEGKFTLTEALGE